MQVQEITVVVPTRNEAHNIGPFLESLPPACALIVVDASDDETAAIVQQLRPHRSRVIRRPSTIPEARQIGMESADTEWLLFTDADVVFPADYFEQLARFTEELDCVYGPKLSLDRFRRYYRFFAWGQWLSDAIGIPAVSGSNLVVRRRVAIDAGGFDPALICNEDSELGWRLKRHGARIGFARQLIVYARDHRRLERGLLRKTLHSVARCFLLRFDLIPDRWRRADWGYWAPQRRSQESAASSE